MPYRSVMLNRRLQLCNAIALAISGFTVIAAPGALAQSEGAVQIEEIRIVGSRIIRQDEISTSPVQTLSEADLRADGSMSIGETLQSLPFVGPSLNNNGSAGTSHGSSSLNLRNIGQNRSLVLVNGHRWVNGAGTRGFRDFVDLNTIPQAMIERIEVLQDGATVVYGADAIAGVVNMHTYQNFEGLRIKTNYGETGEGDRETLGVEHNGRLARVRAFRKASKITERRLRRLRAELFGIDAAQNFRVRRRVRRLASRATREGGARGGGGGGFSRVGFRAVPETRGTLGAA